MFLKRIKLVCFRNYRSLELEPETGLNILCGRNAQGKSNFLEAVSLISSQRSERAARDQEMIFRGETGAYVEVSAEREERSGVTASIALDARGGRRLRLNGDPCRGMDLLGQINSIGFLPEDTEIIKGPPSVRRSFVSREASRLSLKHCRQLQQYAKVLRNRNILLRDSRPREELFFWEEQLLRSAAAIYLFRKRFLREISRLAEDRYGRISGEEDVLRLEYLSQVRLSSGQEEETESSEEDVVAAFREALERQRQREVVFKTTLVGPHRDDFSISLGGRDIQKYGSQGEQRTAVLAIKMAGFEILRKRWGEAPILLLDDVFSEIDENRRERLLEEVLGEKVQTFITTTEDALLPLSSRGRGTLFRVENGRIAAGG